MSRDSTHNSAYLVLALETSQRAASVALRDRAGEIHEERLSPRKRHDDDLMPAIDRLFRRCALAPADLRGGAACVSIGPGGFTGLRIAIATAKMLAETLDVRLVAVPSSLVAAEGIIDQPEAPGDVRNAMVALACKGESFWMTRVGRDAAGGPWSIVGEPGIARAETFDVRSIDAVLADEFFPDAARRAVQAAGIAIIEPVLAARACLCVGERMLLRSETTDPLRLVPLYPRPPEAVTLWENKAKRADE